MHMDENDSAATELPESLMEEVGEGPEDDLSADGPVAQRIRQELAAMVPTPAADFILAETTDGRGRGLYAAVPIDAGTFLFDYGGELIEQEEFASRYPDGTDAEYAVRLIRDDGSSMYMDAVLNTDGSNLARFMNHDDAAPNCVMWTILTPQPRLMLFTQLPLAAGDELLWDYGEGYWQDRSDMI